MSMRFFSVRCCTSEAVAMSGACSPPRPSAPWHTAQFEANKAELCDSPTGLALDLSCATKAPGVPRARKRQRWAITPYLCHMETSSPAHPWVPSTLEEELQRNLHDTGIVSTSYVTETTLAGVIDEPIRIRKLRMVEDIECLCPKLQLNALGYVS